MEGLLVRMFDGIGRVGKDMRLRIVTWIRMLRSMRLRFGNDMAK